MTARYTNVDRVYLAACHQLSLFHCPLNGLHSRFNIDHHSLLHTFRRAGADTDNFNVTLQTNLANYRHHLRCADVETYYQFFILHAAHGSASPFCRDALL